MDRVILHVDMNNFYASVECLLNPSLDGKAVAVGGSVEDRRGIILARNMLAKNTGVTTGETIWQARQKCPDLIIVPPQFHEYMKFSNLAQEIYARYTGHIEPFGVDECWLDVSGCEMLFGDGERIAHQIRRSIKSELGLTVSVGVSFNKIFAKLGSDLKKPDAVTLIPKESFRDKLWGLPARDLMGVGPSTQKVLDRFQVKTIGDLARIHPSILAISLKGQAYKLHAYANGLDDAPVLHKDFVLPAKSVGRGSTTPIDLTHNQEVWQLMRRLCQDIGHTLRSYKMKAQGVSISIKNKDFNTRQWQRQLPVPTQSASYMARNAFSLFEKAYRWDKDVRAVTVTAINLCPENTPCQLDMFCDAELEYKLAKVDAVVDDLRGRFGEAIQ